MPLMLRGREQGSGAPCPSLCTARGCGQGLSAGWDWQCSRVTEPLGPCELTAPGHKLFQQQEPLLLLLPRWVLVPCGAGLWVLHSGLGFLLSCQQVAVALTLLDFDRLGPESFRVLGKLPK